MAAGVRYGHRLFERDLFGRLGRLSWRDCEASIPEQWRESDLGSWFGKVLDEKISTTTKLVLHEINTAGSVLAREDNDEDGAAAVGMDQSRSVMW